MRDGLSIELSDIVSAEELDYEDVSTFLVVCPCCREALTKVVRPGADGQKTHYLRHRPQGGEDEAQRFSECERRVSSMSRADLEAIAAAARGQALQDFERQVESHVFPLLEQVHNRFHATGPRASTVEERVRAFESGAFWKMVLEQEKAGAGSGSVGLIRSEPGQIRHDIDVVLERLARHRRTVPDSLKEKGAGFLLDLVPHLATPQMARCRSLVLAAGAWRAMSRVRHVFDLADSVPLGRMVAEGPDKPHIVGAAQIEAIVNAASTEGLAKSMKMIRRAVIGGLAPGPQHLKDRMAERFMRYALRESIVEGTALLLAEVPFASQVSSLHRRTSMVPPLPLAPDRPSLVPVTHWPQGEACSAHYEDPRSMPPGHSLIVSGSEQDLCASYNIRGWEMPPFIRDPLLTPENCRDTFHLKVRNTSSSTAGRTFELNVLCMVERTLHVDEDAICYEMVITEPVSEYPMKAGDLHAFQQGLSTVVRAGILGDMRAICAHRGDRRIDIVVGSAGRWTGFLHEMDILAASFVEKTLNKLPVGSVTMQGFEGRQLSRVAPPAPIRSMALRG